MTPEQKIKWVILDFINCKEVITSENIDEVYDGQDYDVVCEAKYEVRGSGTETGLPAPSSRHYEAESVAAQAPDGSWVGWTYWYGGGKHGEPEAIDWVEHAYDVECKEEEKVVVVRTFTKDITQ